ncbi:DUF6268 family outer membrane beta-barrel protein [Pedosphaera parvula]|uniref:DUF6268 domain-containing protein n=1 Tax=Pedosphaera parvula (strain Ellin514) TaxID=320771 RepID=B9XBQ9_PEDPL|nr:DUF6268 family outer membrane beta-barrel protein [Pedosphaera parvula]EEF62944.1 hypothetical protein Cflav_PD5579 [Pedosphaera parvula Ellin514]
MKKRTLVSTTVLTFCVSLAPSFAAELESPTTKPSDTPGGDVSSNLPKLERIGGPLRLNAYVNSSYVAAGNVKFLGFNFGSSDAASASLVVNTDIPINDEWFIPAGLVSDNFFLGTDTFAPVPERINTLRFSTGAGYKLNDQWTIVGTLSPLLYNLEQINSNDIGLAGAGYATYKFSPDLVFTFGLVINPDGEWPVFPIGGLIWNINKDFGLDLTLPKPRFVYHANPNLNLYVGGELKATTFRTTDQIAKQIGTAAFNNALGTYRDFHVGVGVEYKITPGVGLYLDGGYSVGREINYTRIDETVKFDPAPYVQGAVRCRF